MEFRHISFQTNFYLSVTFTTYLSTENLGLYVILVTVESSEVIFYLVLVVMV